MRTSLSIALCAGFLGVSAGSANALVFGQIDDFQNGTVMNWTGGPNNPNPPVNVANGGPLGTGDRFMRLTSVGGSSAGSRLVAINANQWQGNYTAEGVTVIRMNLNNLGATNLNMRILFEGITGTAMSTSSVNVASGSGWVTAVFPIAAGNLTATSGTAAGALATTIQIRLFHSPTATFPPEAIVASLGVDNINAVPEPASMVALGAGALALISRRRRRSA